MKIRRIQPSDLDQFYQMIIDSTSGKTLINKTRLHDDLFDTLQPKTVFKTNVPIFEFDANLAKSNATVCDALVAEMDNEKLAGYIIYSHFYSPWKGQCVNLVDVYTRPEHRRAGVAKLLVKHFSDQCRENGFSDFVFNMTSLSDELRRYLSGFELQIIRDGKSDWNVFRIEFVNIIYS